MRKAANTLDRTEPLDLLVGDSAPMRQLRALILRIAPTDTGVLVLGESGTGKELVAQAIHKISPRNRNHFVPVNCGAIPAELMESELFGHRKGAFTGATEDRRGRFELANAGSIFLDEIGDMRLDMQVKLLRVLETRTIDRVGEDQARAVDVRIVAATHRHLEDAVDEGKFRADLFYRLNVFPLQVPALRERGNDVFLLFDHFAQLCVSFGQQPIQAGPCLLTWLLSHSWPGNCRELLNFVMRLTVLWPGAKVLLRQIPPAMLPRARGAVDRAADDRDAVYALSDWGDLAIETPHQDGALSSPSAQDHLTESSLAAELSTRTPQIPKDGVDLRTLIANFELAWIREALSASSGNITHAAEKLGMRRTTLIERMRKYGLSDSRQPAQLPKSIL